MQQRSGPSAVGSFDNFEVAERRRVDEQTLGAGAERDFAHVGEIDFLRVAKIVDQCAGGAHRRRSIVEAEAGQALRPKLLDERAPRRFLIEGPAGSVGHARITADVSDEGCGILESFRGDDFARLENSQLVAERLTALGVAVLRAGELSGRHIEECDAIASRLGGRSDRHEERGFPRLQVASVGQSARRDNADDLAPHQSLGFLWILDLFADGDAKAFLDEARDVSVGGVERHAAHGNRTAVRVL